MQSFAKTLALMKKKEDHYRVKTLIRFGKTLDGVNYNNLKNLLKLAEKTVFIDLDGVDLHKICSTDLIARELLEVKSEKKVSIEAIEQLFLELSDDTMQPIMMFLLKSNEKLLHVTYQDKTLL